MFSIGLGLSNILIFAVKQDLEQRTILNSEDIKQALFRTAGYGGRCL